MQKAVSTVSFHVGGLTDAGVLKKVDGKYAVTTPEKVDNLVLQAMAEGPKTLDEITSDKRLSMFPVERVHQSIDRHLLRRRLVSWPRVTTEAGSSHFVDEYKLSYLGAETLHVCLHCGRPLGDGPVVQFHVKEGISERWGAQSLGHEEDHHGALLHASCFAEEQKEEYREQEKLRWDGLCGLCGLPIDPSALEEEFSVPKVIGVRSLASHLSGDELVGLVSYATNGKVHDKLTLEEVDLATRALPRREKLIIRGLADCERLLQLADEGLRKARRKAYEKIDVQERAKTLWDIASAMIKSDEERIKRLVNEICSPQGVLLGRTTLYLQVYPFMEKGEFTEEEAYYVGGRKEFGMMKGSIEDSGLGVAFKKDGKLYHLACYAMIRQIDGPNTAGSPTPEGQGR